MLAGIHARTERLGGGRCAEACRYDGMPGDFASLPVPRAYLYAEGREAGLGGGLINQGATTPGNIVCALRYPFQAIHRPTAHAALMFPPLPFFSHVPTLKRLCGRDRTSYGGFQSEIVGHLH